MVSTTFYLLVREQLFAGLYLVFSKIFKKNNQFFLLRILFSTIWLNNLKKSRSIKIRNNFAQLIKHWTGWKHIVLLFESGKQI